MGTYYRVSLVMDSSINASTSRAELEAVVESKLKELNQSLSTYIPNSLINQFNALDSGQCIETDKHLKEVFKVSQLVNEQSEQRFNPAIGNLIKLWGFGSDVAEGMPDHSDIAALLKSSSFSSVFLDPAFSQTDGQGEGALCKSDQVSIDFSAVAKGYAVDVIADDLFAIGYKNLLIDIGGELKGRGKNNLGTYWTVAVEKPEVGLSREIQQVIEINNSGVATSGNYRNFFVHDGVSYAHTLDPRTGYPVQHDLLSVTVTHPQTAVADAWATALMAAGAADAIRLVLEHELSVYLVVKPGFGSEGYPGGNWSEHENGLKEWFSPEFHLSLGDG